MNTHLREGTILVTGGSGFIGSALIWRLNDLGYERILVSDRLGSDERWKNLVALKYLDFIHADDLFERAPWDEIKTIFHLGACSATTELDADFLLRNNYQYTKDLAEISIAKGIRFVYASSAATYGDGSLGMDDRMEEPNLLKPLNMYGYSKQMFDLWAQRAKVLDQIVGVKYFNVFGPNEGHKGDMRSVVAKAFQEVKKEKRISLFKSYREDFADGEQKRDFVYVKDAVDASIHLAAIQEAGGIYNVGSGRASTWNELAECIFGALGMETSIRYVEMPQVLQGKYQYYTRANVEKLSESGYSVGDWTLRKSVSDYVKNYLAVDKMLGE